MSEYRVEITEPAEADLREIAFYWARERLEPEKARAIVQRIAGSIFELETMPTRCPLVQDERLARLGVRRLTVDSYLVFFTLSEERELLTVIRILQSKRDWANLL